MTSSKTGKENSQIYSQCLLADADVIWYADNLRKDNIIDFDENIVDLNYEFCRDSPDNEGVISAYRE